MTFSVTSRYFHARITRTYWVPSSGGYVRDVTDQPGTLGPQVCEYLDSMGRTLTATPETLPRVIRRELARRRYRENRLNGHRESR